MGKAIGVGGVFLHLKGEKQALHDWYETHLRLSMSPYGTGFIEGKQLMLVSLVSTDENAPVINFRVDNIEEIAKELKSIQIEFVMDVETYSYGKFARFVEPFGNLIELWEPNEEAYIDMVKSEIENYKHKK